MVLSSQDDLGGKFFQNVGELTRTAGNYFSGHLLKVSSRLEAIGNPILPIANLLRDSREARH